MKTRNKLAATLAASVLGFSVVALAPGAGAQDDRSGDPRRKDDTRRDDMRRDDTRRDDTRRDDTRRDDTRRDDVKKDEGRDEESRRDEGRRDERDDRYLVPASDTYSVDCRIIEGNDNDRIPPTLFGQYPTRGSLAFLAVGEVLHGQVGSTRLDGAKFAMFGKSAGDWKRGKRFDALSLYMDESSSADQRRALGTIFRNDDVFRSETAIPLSTVRIDLDRGGADMSGPIRAKIGTRGTMTVIPMKGNDGRNPIAVLNGFSFFDDREPVQLGTATINYRDHGRELKVTNGSGEIHNVRLSGRLRDGVTEDKDSRKDDSRKDDSRKDDTRRDDRDSRKD